MPKKRYIAAVPQQPDSTLHKTVYQSMENSSLAYAQETRFPIIPVIANTALEGEKIFVTLIYSEYENCHTNFVLLQTELNTVTAAVGCSYQLEIIKMPYNNDIDTHLRLFIDIIAAIGDDEILYSCITYGNKPTPIIMSMALSYAYKIRNNVVIGAIVYGRFDFNTKKSYLHDTTSLFYMDSIVNRLAGLQVKEPEKLIRTMLNLDV